MAPNFQSMQQEHRGVDLADMLINFCCAKVKTKRWYIKVF